jgi:hypothetical protein
MSVDTTLDEFSRLVLLVMYAILSRAVSGYHYVKGKYLEYRYSSNEIIPNRRYFLAEDGDDHKVLPRDTIVPEGWVYIEEWVDIKGHTRIIPLYGGDEILHEWSCTPFDMPPPKCPWVWVGDKDTETDLTRTFDKFLVPGNVIKTELVSKFTKHTNLIYIETKTFNQIKFPGEGITIEADVD